LSSVASFSGAASKAISSSRSSSSPSMASFSAPAFGSGIFLDLLEGSIACPDFETSP